MGWVFHASPEVEEKSQWPMLVGVVSTMMVLAILVVGSRLWIRYTSNRLSHDDLFASLSLIFAFAYTSLAIAQTRFGLGLPLDDRPPQSLDAYTKTNFAGRPIYLFGVGLFKIALLISYQRLLKGTYHKMYSTVIWIITGIVFLSHLACAIAMIFACQPVDKSWHPEKDGTCLSPEGSVTLYAAITIAADLIVTTLPIPILFKLQIGKRQKAGLAAMFALGIFTTICSIMRYVQLKHLEFLNGDATTVVLWGCIEFSVGNIVTSMPFLAPVLIRTTRKLGYKTSSGYGTHGTHGTHGTQRSFHEAGNSSYVQCGPEEGNIGLKSKFNNLRPFKKTEGSHAPTDSHSSREAIAMPELSPPDNSIVRTVTYDVNRNGHQKRGIGQSY